MAKLDVQFLELIQEIRRSGTYKQGRNGGTKSIFDYKIVHDMREGFPLLTCKKTHFKSVKSELNWFMQGRTDLKFLLDRGNKIWVGDFYKKYKSENLDSTLTKDEYIKAVKIGEIVADGGKIYGHQWNKQLPYIIEQLRTNPNSRRTLLMAWNYDDLDEMLLPPCHIGFKLYAEELTVYQRALAYCNSLGKDSSYCYKLDEDFLNEHSAPTHRLSLKWWQRSVDVLLGLPFNIASYGLLLTRICNKVNMIPSRLIGDLSDLHIYSNQVNSDYYMLLNSICDLDLPTLDKDENLINYKWENKLSFPLSN
jgi:thymidylate synthase